MDKLLGWSGNIAALLGVLVCGFSGIARLAGDYHVVGYEAMTLFTGGIALMVLACLAKLWRLEANTS